MSFIGIDDRGGVDDRLNPRTKRAADITLPAGPGGVAVNSDGKTAFVANTSSGTVSTIDVKTRKKSPTDITVGSTPARRVHARRQDRLRHQQRQRHRVDD
jgi:YVTN family beta-propeller protein